MARVKGKDTSLEQLVRKAIFRRGFRFRKHVSTVMGKPDVVFRRARVAVFIDGDFWHGWRFPKWKTKLPELWQTKIENTRKRDARTFRLLRSRGWTVIRVWEHEVLRDLNLVVDRIVSCVIRQR